MNFVHNCLIKDPTRRYDIHNALGSDFLRQSVPEYYRNTIA